MTLASEELQHFRQLLVLAFREDLGMAGDVTSDSIFNDETASATLIAKQEGVFCGVELIGEILSFIDCNLVYRLFIKEGEEVEPGCRILAINGKLKSILKSERVLLNFLGKLSGIATRTRAYVTALEGSETKILDTRKTTPGFRILEKYAVKVGGGENHRMGLYDMVMIKDNHIDGAGSIESAISKVRKLHGKKFRIEVETRNIKEVEEALKHGADIIMLDNMSLEEMKAALAIINGRVKAEISGNVNLNRIPALKELNADYISTSDITVHAQPLDLSLLIKL